MGEISVKPEETKRLMDPEIIIDRSRMHDKSTPWIGILLSNCTSGWGRQRKTQFFKYFTMALTFLTYASYHMTRKVISVVTPVLENGSDSTNESSWKPFNNTKTQDNLMAGLDVGFLLAYAFGMYVCGHIAERVDLRYFLTIGMTLSALFTAMFGLGYYMDVHDFSFFLVAQTLNGLAQSTGWPAVVPLMGNWFGYGKRGLILGVWNSHTSVGNILGSVLAGLWVDTQWGMSFLVPAGIMFGVAVLLFLSLTPFPEMVFCTNPNHSAKKKPVTPAATEGSGRGAVVDSSSELEDESFDDEQVPIVKENSFRVGQLDETIFVQERNERENEESERAKPAIGITKALMVPGVIEYAMCLFFNKLVSYSFLFWLPTYIEHSQGVSSQDAANISIAFDMGGLVGGILLGVISDALRERSLITAVSIVLSLPIMGLYNEYGDDNFYGIPLLVLSGLFVNGPYALITTAISADLGTHEVLRSDSRALSTVTAIIDGTGSMGAALGVLVCFELSTDNVFWFLIASDFVALLFLSRLLWKSVTHYREIWKEFTSSESGGSSTGSEHRE